MEVVGQQYTIELVIASIKQQRSVSIIEFSEIVTYWRNIWESQDPISLAEQNLYLALFIR